jgi:hypothetical protein
MKYRCTCTIIFDFETDLPYEQAINLAKDYLDEIPIKEGLENTRTVLQLDKLKSKVEKIKLGEFKLDEVFPFITEENSKKQFIVNDKTYDVKMNTDRYHLFRNNLSCVSCGLNGTRLFLECHPADMKPHFNLYGEEDRKLVLFTKDHITARAFGGENTLENYQTMCSTCNSLKAHSNLSLESVSKLRKIYNDNRKKITKKKLHVLIEDERKKLELPWPHLIYEQKNIIPKNGIQVNCDLAIIEEDANLICIPEKQLPESILSRGHIKDQSYLEEIVEINGMIVCKLTDGRIVRLNKKYMK